MQVFIYGEYNSYNSENLTLQTFGKEKKKITAAEVIAIPK